MTRPEWDETDAAGEPEIPCAGSCPAGCSREHKHHMDHARPVWCHACQDNIIRSLDTIVRACKALRPGKLAMSSASDQTRTATRTASPSASPAWDTIDDAIRLLTSWEDAFRDHIGHTSMEGRPRYLVDTVTYLRANKSPFMAWEISDDAGREINRLSAMLERAAGLDLLVHKLPVPCPECNRMTLRRHDGRGEVICADTRCDRMWGTDEYAWMVHLAVATEQNRKAIA